MDTVVDFNEFTIALARASNSLNFQIHAHRYILSPKTCALIVKTKHHDYLQELARVFDQVNHHWLLTTRGISGIYKHYRQPTVTVRSFLYVYVMAHAQQTSIDLHV